MPERPVGTLIRTSLSDYPGKVAAAVFLCGCDLRCPYCHNAELLGSPPEVPPDGAWAGMDEILRHLERRRSVLSALAISGGEPLLSPKLPQLVSAAKSMGYLVKLDTNGMHPEALASLCGDRATRPDYIAMDIKTSPARYGMLGAESGAARRLRDTARLMRDMLSPECREWRTVLVPGLVGKDDIAPMADVLPEDAAWLFSAFRNGNCLSPALSQAEPLSPAEAEELVALASALRRGARLRQEAPHSGRGPASGSAKNCPPIDKESGNVL